MKNFSLTQSRIAGDKRFIDGAKFYGFRKEAILSKAFIILITASFFM